MTRREKIIWLVGGGLIALGFLLNPYTIGTWFRAFPRPITGGTNLFIIYTTEVFLVALGAILIWKRNNFNGKAMARAYSSFAANALTAFLIFVAVNVAIYAWSIIHLSLGGTTAVNPIAAKYNITLNSLYPGMTDAQIAQLLQENWSRPPVFDSFDEFKERPIQGTYVNVDAQGFFRDVVGQVAWPPNPKNFNIYLFGGSTTFGYGVADKDTIASYLQGYLQGAFPGKTIAIYNFGTAAYYSSQERVRFERLLLQGYPAPNIALFIDGLNDSYFAKVNDDTTVAPQLAAGLSGDTAQDVLNKIPLIGFLNSYLSHASSTDAPVPNDPVKVAQTIARYTTDKTLIEAVANHYGTKAFFVWQPVPVYKYDTSHDPFISGTDAAGEAPYVYPVMDADAAKNGLGNDFLNLDAMQVGIEAPLYVDSVHYTPGMSQSIASRIADWLKPSIAATP